MNYITVSALNNYLKRKFEADVHLNYVYLKGEISNFKPHSRGHMYFSIKDDTSVINAIMFQGNASKLNFEPKDGDKVLVEGKVVVYEATGKYQIILSNMQLDGIGELYIAYEKLKKELEKEGLFNRDRKKIIPKFPKKIGIITAPTGAAIKDILSTIKRRFPICETLLFPSLVQGKDAAPNIVKNITLAQNYDLDVLIVGRGGGSIEDLWAFNEEIVARAIYASKIPIISAVGHEVDFTIADFVADLRAPTPTGAAEMAVPNISDVLLSIEQYKIRMDTSIRNKIVVLEKKLDALKNSYVLKNPMGIYEVKEQKLASLIDKLTINIQNKITNNQVNYNNLINTYIFKHPMDLFKNKSNEYNVLLNKLELLNPLSILKKGYSVVSFNGNIINSTNNLKKDDIISIRMSKGILKTEIKEIIEDGK